MLQANLRTIALALTLATPLVAGVPVQAASSGEGAWNDIGCDIDPNGCANTAAGKDGALIDPHGGAVTLSSQTSGDIGCDIDPHGVCAA